MAATAMHIAGMQLLYVFSVQPLLLFLFFANVQEHEKDPSASFASPGQQGAWLRMPTHHLLNYINNEPIRRLWEIRKYYQ